MGYYKEPEWGMTKFSDGQMFEGIKKFQKDNNLQVDGVMKAGGETENAFNKVLRYGEYAATAAQQGLSYGWADEAEGVMGGVGYALGSLNPNWNKSGESMSEAYKRGYINARDYRRNVLNEGYEKAPYLTGTMETVGAIAAPGPKISKSAPLKIQATKARQQAIAGGAAYGAGAGEGDWKQHGENMLWGISGGFLGNSISQFSDNNYTRLLASPGAREAINRTTSTLTGNLIENNLKGEKDRK